MMTDATLTGSGTDLAPIVQVADIPREEAGVADFVYSMDERFILGSCFIIPLASGYHSDTTLMFSSLFLQFNPHSAARYQIASRVQAITEDWVMVRHICSRTVLPVLPMVDHSY